MPLVELFGTDDGSVAKAIAFYRSVGRHPITMNKQLPGHVANRLTSAIFREAVWMLKEGIVSPLDPLLSPTHRHTHTTPQPPATYRHRSRPQPALRTLTIPALSTQASVEDIDAAMSQGPGMRFAHMGPFQTYHLAAGDGGIAQYLEHLGPSQVPPRRVQLLKCWAMRSLLHGVCGRRPGGRALERALCWSRG